MRTLILAILIPLLSGCGSESAPIAAESTDATSKTGIVRTTKIVTVAGTVRCDPETKMWAIIDDVDHTKLHLNRVVSSNDVVQVGWDFKATKVITLQVTVDETYAEIGLIAGSSVGLETTNIRFNLAALGMTSADDLCIEGANLWIHGLFEVQE